MTSDGSDNAITLARFEQLVARGKIHYYVAGGGGPGGGAASGSSASGISAAGTNASGTSASGTSASGTNRTRGPGMGGGVSQMIETWVAKHFTSTTVGGMSVYDLTQRTS